jgi:hypothetical protein
MKRAEIVFMAGELLSGDKWQSAQTGRSGDAFEEQKNAIADLVEEVYRVDRAREQASQVPALERLTAETDNPISKAIGQKARARANR